MRRSVTVFLAVLILTPMLVHAQPNLDMKRAVVNWPAVELYFSVACGGTPVYNMQATDFRVYDNGEEMGSFTLSCPDPTQSCPMSVGLVIDASGSMVGAWNTGAIAAGKAFVGTMDGQTDEAAVLWFNTMSTLQQGMTSDTALLNTALDAIPAVGGTAVWDAIWIGLQHVNASASNSCRAVIALADGSDNSSSRTPAELIAYANSHHIRLFTVGLGASFNNVEFEQIARLTGGRFYQTTTVTQLPMIYQEIASIIHAGFQECSLVYDATCADGVMHNVELQLVNFCGGTDSKTKSYIAPLDTNTFATLPLRLGNVVTMDSTNFEIPLLIDTTLAGQSFPPLTIDLCFSSHMLGFRGAEVPIGSPLTWMQVFTTPIGCGMRIQTQTTGTVTGSGELLRLKFHANAAPNDTILSQVIASLARLETGCLQPVVQPATVTIVPRGPVLFCDMDAPRSVTWDTLQAAYTPSPFQATLRVFNTGTKASTGGSCEIMIDTTMLRLVTPMASLVAIPDIPAGEFREVIWLLDALPQTVGDSTDITMTAHFSNHGDQSCMIRQYIGESVALQGPVLSLRCYVPDSLHYDEQSKTYDPNPFVVRLSAVNIGSDTAWAVTGRLVLPTGLELVNPTEPLTKTVRSGALGPWQIGDAVPEVQWQVRWTKREDHDIDLPIRFVVSGQNESGTPLTDVPTECSVRIKGLRREFVCTVERPDTLDMNQAGDDYAPNPVPLRLRIVNSGQLDVKLTRVTFAFPSDGLRLDPSSPQGLDVPLNHTLAPGDDTSFVWFVDVQKRGISRTPRFEWMAYDESGKTISCEATMVIPGLPVGALDCELISDTITGDLTAQSYHPMPFALHLRTRSNKLAVTDSVFARVLLPPGALALAASDAGREVKPLSPARIFPQQEAQVTWMLEHPVSTTEQRYTVRTLLWEQGGDTSICETEVLIPAIPAPFWFTLSASGPTSFCDGGEVTLNAGAGYATYRWSTQDTTQSIVVRQSGTYWCAVTAADGLPGLSHNVTVTVFPLPAKPVITRTGDLLATDAAAAWQWYLDGTEIPGATAQTHAAVETGNYTVRIIDTNGCEALSDPHQVLVLFVDEGPVAGQRFQLYPNPASGELTVDVVLDRPSVAVIVLHDLLGRELRRVVRSESSAGFTQRLDIRGLRPGLYVVQLVAGPTRQSRVLVVR